MPRPCDKAPAFQRSNDGCHRRVCGRLATGMEARSMNSLQRSPRCGQAPLRVARSRQARAISRSRLRWLLFGRRLECDKRASRMLTGAASIVRPRRDKTNRSCERSTGAPGTRMQAPRRHRSVRVADRRSLRPSRRGRSFGSDSVSVRGALGAAVVETRRPGRCASIGRRLADDRIAATGSRLAPVARSAPLRVKGGALKLTCRRDLVIPPPASGSFGCSPRGPGR
jgi:hypothetical protein